MYFEAACLHMFMYVFQGLTELCNCNQLMRKCVDLEDWCSAAAVNIHLKNYTQVSE